MIDKLLVKVAKGVIVRIPESWIKVSETGTKVANNSFWRRRIKAGDVQLVKKITEVKDMRIKSKAKIKTEKKVKDKTEETEN